MAMITHVEDLKQISDFHYIILIKKIGSNVRAWILLTTLIYFFIYCFKNQDLDQSMKDKFSG